jgi:hypothetical protein
MGKEEAATVEAIRLEFQAKWNYIEHVWTFMQNMLGDVLTKKQAEYIALSISELCENSVKYSKHKFAELNVVRINIEINRDQRLINLEIENFANPDHVVELERELERLTTGDAKKLWREKLIEASQRDDGGSQLGLIRIIYEAKGRIRMVFDRETNKLCIHSEFDMHE